MREDAEVAQMVSIATSGINSIILETSAEVCVINILSTATENAKSLEGVGRRCLHLHSLQMQENLEKQVSWGKGSS